MDVPQLKLHHPNDELNRSDISQLIALVGSELERLGCTQISQSGSHSAAETAMEIDCAIPANAPFTKAEAVTKALAAAGIGTYAIDGQKVPGAVIESTPIAGFSKSS